MLADTHRMENLEAARIAREQWRAAEARNRHHGRVVTDDYAGRVIGQLERRMYDELHAGRVALGVYQSVRKATLCPDDYAEWCNAVIARSHEDDLASMPDGYFGRREVIVEWARGESVESAAWRLHEVIHEERDARMGLAEHAGPND